jgi:type III restriction enzyme
MIVSEAKGLYDQVQIDSDNEKHFVPLLEDDHQLIFYFKFPPAFKVPLPRQIGNYNPDWGIARLDDTGASLLQVKASVEETAYTPGSVTSLYVRETKGTENLADLQWPHEKRKIICALKYFQALGLDYHPVKGDNATWYEKNPESQSLYSASSSVLP